MPPLTPPPQATPPAAMLGGGTQAQVRIELNNVTRSLIRCLGLLKGVSSEEGKAILTALKALQPITPDVDEGVSQSEIKALLEGAQTATPGPGPGRMAGGPLGPMPPRPMAPAGVPFGMNQAVPAPGVGGRPI